MKRQSTAGRRRRAPARFIKFGWLAAIALLLFAASALADRPDAQAAARGREIYQHGVAADGSQIKCASGPQDTEVPAAILKCASCHSDDGRGKAEGGVFPPNIRWSELGKPYSLALPGGRTRPPYTERLLIRAITLGLDADGHRLNSTMPRYRLTHEQAADLIAYLKELEYQSDPGLKDDSVTVGVMLPPDASQPRQSRAVRETLTAVFDDVNRHGGIYGRKLVAAFASAPPENSAAALDEFITRVQPFVLISHGVAGQEEAAAAVIERHQLPDFQPLPFSTGWQPHRARYIFHLASGQEGQCAALARFASASRELAAKGSLLVVEDRATEGLLEALPSELPKESAPALRAISAGAVHDWPSYLRETKPQAVIWLASGGVEELLAAGEAIGTYPLVLVPGSLFSPGIYHAPKGFAGRISLSFPLLPGDQSREGRAEFDRLGKDYHWAEGDPALRRSTLAAARLLVQGLQDTGREVTRESLVSACERFYQLDVQQMRPLSFGPGRRVGTTGAHIVGVDLEKGSLSLTSQWIECEVR